ncbi:type II toxin-antitoxin system RelE/ParE family toxin [Inquilinus limosus]|uniref:type II toxin-antitoxin system RelE/ParE family toxin n=1 Tax=Inquilinus limosus TaxID=171674 RepID=UPI001B7F8B67|nr:type II toxin-antitoxin system RelE/ParE family toxin [Inquilinus limosus]
MSIAANDDFTSILHWTIQAFGPKQASDYQLTIGQAIRALEGGPDLPDSKARDEVRAGVRILRVARRGRRGRHILVYRVIDEDVIEVLRILHDSMDLARHVP